MLQTDELALGFTSYMSPAILERLGRFAKLNVAIWQYRVIAAKKVVIRRSHMKRKRCGHVGLVDVQQRHGAVTTGASACA